MIDPAWVIAGCAVGTLLITLAIQWTRYEAKLAEVKADADNALQVAAEAAEGIKRFDDEIDRGRRDAGEGLTGMRAKIHEIETWSRDEFVRKTSFEAVIARMEKSQERRDDALDQRLDRIEQKVDAAPAAAAAAAVEALARIRSSQG